MSSTVKEPSKSGTEDGSKRTHKIPASPRPIRNDRADTETHGQLVSNRSTVSGPLRAFLTETGFSRGIRPPSHAKVHRVRADLEREMLACQPCQSRRGGGVRFDGEEASNAKNARTAVAAKGTDTPRSSRLRLSSLQYAFITGLSPSSTKSRRRIIDLY